MQGLELAGEASDMFPDRVALARLSLSGLDLAATLAALLEQELPPRPAGDFALEVEGLQVGQQGASLAKVAALRLAGSGGAIETSRFALRGLSLERGPLFADWFDRYGYRQITGEMASEGRYDRQSGALDAERLDIALPELGSFGMRYRLTGMTPDRLDTQDFSDIRLEAAQLRLTDAGFYRRLLADEARRSDQPEAKIRAGYLAAVTGLLGGAKAAGPLLPPVQRFLRGEATTLELTVAPAQPVGLEALDQASKRGPAAVQRLLGLRLEAK